MTSEAVAAGSAFGVTRERADRYAESIQATLPLAFETMALPDGSERTAGIDALARLAHGVSEGHNIRRIVERGLTAIAVRIVREIVRRGATERGFTPDELEAEFSAFADQLEGRLFA